MPHSSVATDYPVEFLFVRHGQTDWNVVRRIQGHSDIPLNPTGYAQAVACGEALRQEAAIDQIFTSDLLRAHQTAHTIAQQLAALAPARIECDTRLRERHYGLLEGLTPLEIEQRYPRFHREWCHRDIDARFGREDQDHAGESLVMLKTRAMDFLNSTLVALPAAQVAQAREAHTPIRIMVVSHGGWIDVVLRTVRRMSLSAMPRHTIANASVHKVRWGVNPQNVAQWLLVA